MCTVFWFFGTYHHYVVLATPYLNQMRDYLQNRLFKIFNTHFHFWRATNPYETANLNAMLVSRERFIILAYLQV